MDVPWPLGPFDQEEEVVTEQPLLAEETYAILHRLLDKADAGRMRLQLKCGPKETPELYLFDDQPQVELVWDDLKQLAHLGVLDLKLKRQRAGYNEYDEGRIDLLFEAEGVVREWLQRPGFDPQYHLWSHALEKHRDVFEDEGDALKQNVLQFAGRSYNQLAAAFASVADALQEPLTLRQLSARCFWGDSKFLDPLENVIRATYPSLFHNLLPRPVLLPIYLPSELESILFVENQDTFLAMVQRGFPGLALVNMGGFRGTALRVRQPGQAFFSYVGTPDTAVRRQFEHFWLGHNPLSTYFWGDLDYAGLRILAALNVVFPGTRSWEAGYRPMLASLEGDAGHSSGAARKEKQVKPGVIGCDYADYVLLPAVERHQSFVDQEVVNVAELQWTLEQEDPMVTKTEGGSR